MPLTSTRPGAHQARLAIETQHTKFLPLDAALVGTDGTFQGYASLFDTPDMGNDIIAPGAFTDSIARRGPRGVKLLFHHDPREPIGIWRSLREDSRGLYVEGELSLANSKARDIQALLRSGAIDGLSIGFRAASATRNARTSQRRLTRIDLWEISIVTFPMLPGARVSAVKRMGDPARAGAALGQVTDRSKPTLATLAATIRATA
jgi:uncharacterized protein